MRMYYIYDTKAPLEAKKAQLLSEHLPALTADLVGIRPGQIVIEANSSPVDLTPIPRTDLPEWSQVNNLDQRLRFTVLQGLTEHAGLLEGAWPESNADGPIQTAIHHELANTSFLNVGQRYTLPTGVEVDITGIWQEKDPADPFWYDLQSEHFSDLMWVTGSTYRDRLSPMLEKPIRYLSWYLVMDEKDIEFQKASQYTEGMLRLDNELKNLGIPIKMDNSPLEALVSYQERVRTLTTLLYAVGAPLVVLALLFIGLTSVIVIQEYSQEIAMLRSRGASRAEVLLMNVAETLVLLLLAIPASLLLGWAASNVMGQTESFMRFTQRPLLPFSYNGVNLPALFLAIGLTILARLTPAWYVCNVRSRLSQVRVLPGAFRWKWG